MSDYKWLTNLRTPFDDLDQTYLARLVDYQIGEPQRADRPDAYSIDQLHDAGIVGIYTTAWALRNTGGEAFSVAVAKRELGADHTELVGAIAEELDADLHFRSDSEMLGGQKDGGAIPLAQDLQAAPDQSG